MSVPDEREAVRRSAKVAIVEDDPLIQAAFVRWARRASALPFVVASLEEARSTLEGELSGLILDVGLPDGCGLDLVPIARARTPHLPIIVVTGCHDADVINRAHLLGVEYVVKPSVQLNVEAFLDRCVRPPPEGVGTLINQFGLKHDLTPAERRLLAASFKQCALDCLADELGVSRNTVKKHIGAILAKTHVPTLEEIVAPLRARALRH